MFLFFGKAPEVLMGAKCSEKVGFIISQPPSDKSKCSSAALSGLCNLTALLSITSKRTFSLKLSQTRPRRWMCSPMVSCYGRLSLASRRTGEMLAAST